MVYGVGTLALDLSPVVIQVPDFGDRFWVYQMVDLRTDSFVQLGKMYGTTPGFYLLVGPNWHGEVPKGITEVFRSSTNTGFVAPRVVQDDTPEDKRAIQSVLTGIVMYPLADYDGTDEDDGLGQAAKKSAAAHAAKRRRSGCFRTSSSTSFPRCSPMRRRCQARRRAMRRCSPCCAAAKDNPTLKQAMIEGAKEADEKLVKPLFQFRNYGQQLPHNWSTISNEAAFGTDYFTRTAVAKSNILVNSPNETKYFYQDLDANGARLNGANRYTVTFAQGADAAGQWFLVAVDLQRAPFLRHEPDQPLFGRHQEQGPEVRRRRLVDDLRAGRRADRPGPARQLVAGAQGRFLALCPRLLAKARKSRTVRGRRRPCGERRAPRWVCGNDVTRGRRRK